MLPNACHNDCFTYMRIEFTLYAKVTAWSSDKSISCSMSFVAKESMCVICVRNLGMVIQVMIFSKSIYKFKKVT